MTGNQIQYRAENDRNMAIRQGLGLQGDLRNFVNTNQGRQAQIEDQLGGAWSPEAAGGGGWSQDQLNSILPPDRLDRVSNFMDQQYNNYYLTPEEQAAGQGDPFGAYNRAQEGAGAINDIIGGRNAAIGGRLAGQEGNIRGAVEGNRLNIEQSLTNQDQWLGGALNAGAGNVRGAVGSYRGDLGHALSDYSGGIHGALGMGEANVRGSYNPADLSLNPEFNQNFQFGDRDVQNMVDRAGRTIGQTTQGDIDRTMRANAASGRSTGPLALAAALDRERLTGNVTAGDAMTDARIAARNQQLQTMAQKENMRLGAEQNRAALGSGLELRMAGNRLGAEQALGGARVNAAQGLGVTGVGSEQYLTGAALDTGKYMGSSRVGAEQDIANRQVGAEQYLGGSGLNWTGNMGDTALGAQQYNTNNAIRTYGAGDDADVARNQWLAANRQGAVNTANTNYYNTNMGLWGAQAGVNTNAANTQLQQQNAYKAYLANLQNQANQNVSVGNQQRLGAYGTQLSGQNQATSNAISNYAVPGMGERITNIIPKFLPHAKGAHVTKPHTALVGEEGPEMIVDLLPRYGGGYEPWDDQGDSEPDYSMDVDSVLAGGDQFDNSQVPYSASVAPESRPWWKKTLGNVGMAYTRHNPRIRNAIYDAMVNDVNSGAQRHRPPNTNLYKQEDSAGGGTSLKKIRKVAGLLGGTSLKKIRKVAGLFMADGGVVNDGGYQEQYVDEPTVMKLGGVVPQAVVPLTDRPDAKVRPEDILGLRRKYAGR